MRNSSSISRSFSAAVGSSMISTRDWCDSALAISTICWRATVSEPIRVVGATSRWMRSNSACASRLSWSSSRNQPRALRGSRPMKTFCAALRCGIRCSSWWMMPMPRLCAWAGPFTSTR